MQVVERGLQSRTQDSGFGKQRKVLFFGGDSSARALISTFLVTMGWTCVAATTREEALQRIEHESFDAVLLDLDYAGGPVEPTLFQIREIRPSLAEKVVVISSGTTPSEVRELIERHHLPHLSQNVLLQQLWLTLQDVCLQQTSRREPPKVARLVCDGPAYSVEPGLHADTTRQLTFEYNNVLIDVCIEPQAASGFSVTGQVLNASRRNGRHAGMAIVLTSGGKTLARTITNQSGEFRLEAHQIQCPVLEVRFGDHFWITVPLGKMDW